MGRGHILLPWTRLERAFLHPPRAARAQDCATCRGGRRWQVVPSISAACLLHSNAPRSPESLAVPAGGAQDARPHHAEAPTERRGRATAVYTGLHRGAPIPTAVHALPLRVAQTQGGRRRTEGQMCWALSLLEPASQAAAEA